MGTIEGYQPSLDATETEASAGKLKVFGTTTSPYTRKVRLLARAAGFEVTLVDTRTEEGAAALARIAPLGKVPVIEAPGTPEPRVLPDSGLISAWLWAEHAPALRAAGFADPPGGGASSESWAERELLVVIDGALDAAINRFYLLRDQLPDMGYVTRQRQRVETALAWLDARMPAFARPVSSSALALGCALDWMVFRAAADVARYPHLTAFREAWAASGVGAGTEPG
jgi:glutathione S-transferase